MKYYGITFGPIDRILSYAKSTRSIWASSYFFSDLAKRIVQQLRDKGCEFLKPAVAEEMFNPSTVGKFPDQYVFYGDNISVDGIRQICDGVLSGVGKKINACLKKGLDSDKMLEYLRSKIKIYIVELELELNTDKKEIIGQVQALFACAECRDVYPDSEPTNYLAILFEQPIETLKEFFELSDLKRFDSLPEVAYNHYVVFVSADGDNFGSSLAKDSTLSENFQNFSRELSTLVVEYGGQVIFQGGDDIFFYAPMYSKNTGIDIFGLIKQLDDKLNECLKDKKLDAHTPPSISYGVAISYDKYPMAETRERAISLMHEAKSKGKNSIVWELRKHSGQLCGGFIPKKEKSYFDKMLELINNVNNSTAVNAEFLHSVTFWLKRYEQPLLYILGQDTPNTYLDNFIDNNFNEAVHEDHRKYLTLVKDLLCSAPGEKPEDKIDFVHNLLRYVEHLVSLRCVKSSI